MTATERGNEMAKMYGEVCSKAEAARILRCGKKRIESMLSDGRLDAACEGSRVDVRSIARYIMQPRQEDEAARIRRLKLRRGTEWVV